MARTGSARCGRARRDARAELHDVPRRAGHERSDAPNLAGQYPEVVIKQLHDYKSGKRASAIMEALAKNLSDQDIADLAAYYAYLPKARTAPTTYDESLPALVRVGDPLRNIAPCISCHGGVDQKLGRRGSKACRKNYLVAQLHAFKDRDATQRLRRRRCATWPVR